MMNSSANAEPVVAIIDVETTGIIPDRDRIIEFAAQKGFGPDAFRQAWRVNPGIPIPPQASAVHGISDDDVRDKPPFPALIPVIQKILNGADVIVGYNLEFDLRCIQAEMKRHGVEQFNIDQKLQIDPLKIWRHFEPRKLQDAVKRFAGEDHTSAHSAAGDVEATGKVLTGMLKAFGLDQLSWDDIVNVLEPGRASWLGPTSHLAVREGDVIFNFGKHTTRSVHEVVRTNDGYAEWVINSGFPPHVVLVIRTAKELPHEDFLKWIGTQFPGIS